jgi:uncharacterized protein (TIGR00369 family)
MQEAMVDATGLERLQAIVEAGGKVPPMAETMDYALTEVSENHAVFEGTPSEFHYNPIGSVHGGYFAVLLDSAMGVAVNATLAAGEGHTTLEYKVNLVRALTTETGPIRAEARIVHRGRRMATSEGRIVDSQGKLYAHATTTCMIFPAGNRRTDTNNETKPFFDETEQVRERTYEYSFGEATKSADLSLSGLELFQNRLAEGNFRPPIADTLDFQLESVEEGKTRFVCTPQEFHYNPMGTVHGGLAGTLLDSAMGCAVHTTLPAGVAYTTLEFQINLVRAMTTETGPVKIDGWTVHRGRRMATAEGRITDANGKVYAHGSTTCMVFDLR